jgi:hypothetical protein
MKLSRLANDPAALIDFYQEGLETLGALCERSWHDCLQLVADGRAAQVWNADGALLETELRFVPADATGARKADSEVFAGCPSTFRLAEALRPCPLALEKVALDPFDQGRLPSVETAERLWLQQFSGCARWGLRGSFRAAWHFSLLALLRCEIQAIDQHWSLHRLALTFPTGERDESLADSLDFAQVNANFSDPPQWPAFDPAAWQRHLLRALEEELAESLASIRTRQENYLRRELERVDHYFAGYQVEIEERRARSQSDAARGKMEQRLAAARSEHERRRQDQEQRHEIRVMPHFDALILVAEPAWEAKVSFLDHHQPKSETALFVPRSRRWIRSGCEK